MENGFCVNKMVYICTYKQDLMPRITSKQCRQDNYEFALKFTYRYYIRICSIIILYVRYNTYVYLL